MWGLIQASECLIYEHKNVARNKLITEVVTWHSNKHASLCHTCCECSRKCGLPTQHWQPSWKQFIKLSTANQLWSPNTPADM